MKIATFNINNVNKRLANLVNWLREAPDVVCLQELKATDSEFPVAAIEKASYDAVSRRGGAVRLFLHRCSRDCKSRHEVTKQRLGMVSLSYLLSLPLFFRLAVPGDIASDSGRPVSQWRGSAGGMAIKSPKESASAQ